MGILALLAFFAAFIMHGANANAGPWFDWQGAALLGLAFLAWHVAEIAIPWRK